MDSFPGGAAPHKAQRPRGIEALVDVAIHVEPPTGFSDESRALVKNSEAAIGLDIRCTKFHDAVGVSRSAVMGVDDLQPAPPWVVLKIQ